MRVAILTTDDREHFRDYSATTPYFGTAPEALIQGLVARPDLEVHIISCTRKTMSSPAKLADNIFFHSLLVPKIGWMRTLYYGCVKTVRGKLTEIRPEIVHGQGTERDCAISAVRSGFPNVTTIHGNMAELARLFHARIGSFGWLAARLEDFTLKRTAGVFCNSEYTERLVQPRARRVWRVPNAIREQFFAPPQATPSNQRCLLLNIGLVSPRKRQLELLDVAAELHRRKLDFEFVFVGRADPANPYGAAFLEKIKTLDTCARFVGPQGIRDLIPWLDRSSALIHFPMEEAFGLVVAEALARNLKLFGARTGGIIDIASGVPDAELFDPNDWPGFTEALALWIARGFPRPTGASDVMQKRYHPNVVAERHLEIYREVLRTV